MLYTSAVADYLVACESSGKSENTLESYRRTLDMFGAHLFKNGIINLEQITPAVLVAWRNLTAQRASAASLRLYVAHLKGFFDFCTDIEYVAKNPFKKKLMEVSVKAVDQKDTTSHVLTVVQFRTIFTNNSPRHTHKLSIARNRAILVLFITSGIRCENLCRLTQEDLCGSSIRIQNAKGGKNGQVLFADAARDAVSQYLLSGYRPSYCAPSDTLFGFVDANGEWHPYSREQMSAIVEAAVRGFTGAKGFRAHSMRHTCASLLRAHGLSDGEVSILLMHSDGTGAAVTSRYISRSNQALFQKANAIFTRLIFSQV